MRHEALKKKMQTKKKALGLFSRSLFFILCKENALNSTICGIWKYVVIPLSKKINILLKHCTCISRGTENLAIIDL